MDPFAMLRLEARAKRDRTILNAHSDYKHAITEIAKLRKAMRPKRPTAIESRAVRSGVDRPYSDMTATEAAERVLLEGTPLRLTELTLEVQSRGCRAGDDPRVVAHAIRSAMRYHKGRFVRGKDGRWGVAN